MLAYDEENIIPLNSSTKSIKANEVYGRVYINLGTTTMFVGRDKIPVAAGEELRLGHFLRPIETVNDPISWDTGDDKKGVCIYYTPAPKKTC